jgi:hypothetical protein
VKAFIYNFLKCSEMNYNMKHRSNHTSYQLQIQIETTLSTQSQYKTIQMYTDQLWNSLTSFSRLWLFYLNLFIYLFPVVFKGGIIHYREITLWNQLNVLIIWCLYADFKHLGDQNHREKSCYVACEFIARSLLVGIC